jgi:hypothetical protein
VSNFAPASNQALQIGELDWIEVTFLLDMKLLFLNGNTFEQHNHYSHIRMNFAGFYCRVLLSQ